MAFYCNLFLQIVLGFLIWLSPSIAEEADRTIVAHDRSFDYIKLIIETITSPQVIFLLLIIFLLIKRPKFIDRIVMLDVAGVKVQLQELKESIERTETRIKSIENQLDDIQDEFLETSEDFDASVHYREIDKLGSELKTRARSMESIDFVSEYLKVGSDQGKVYAAACAIQVRPQAKFLAPLASYINEVSSKSDLDGLRLRVAYKLVMCIENVVRSDNRLQKSLLDPDTVKHTMTSLDKLRRHPRCLQDHEKQGKRSIVARIQRTLHQVKILQERLQDETTGKSGRS